MGWDVSPPMGHVVSCKKLRDKGLHTFKGMIGYCMKNNGNKYFEFVHHNVSADDMNGKMEHAKFRKVGLNDRVSLSHSNMLQRPINGLISVWRSILVLLLLELCITWVRVVQHGLLDPDMGHPLWSAGMDVRHATSIWKIMMNPHDIAMEDISNVSFWDSVRVYKHEVFWCTENCGWTWSGWETINHVLHVSLGMHGETRDDTLRDLQEAWFGTMPMVALPIGWVGLPTLCALQLRYLLLLFTTCIGIAQCCHMHQPSAAARRVAIVSSYSFSTAIAKSISCLSAPIIPLYIHIKGLRFASIEEALWSQFCTTCIYE